MEQRRLRLGDILDDYCPRERRVTNHAIVAMIEEDVKQTRCTTCDAEHAYKGARVPKRRKKETPSALYKEVLAAMPEVDAAPVLAVAGAPVLAGPMAIPADALAPAGIAVTAAPLPAEPVLPTLPEPGPPVLAVSAAGEGDDAPLRSSASDPAEEGRPAADDDAPLADGPVHRRLIRATLPRPEGQKDARPIPEFTVRQAPGRGGHATGNFRAPERMRMRGGAAGGHNVPNGNRAHGGGSRFHGGGNRAAGQARPAGRGGPAGFRGGNNGPSGKRGRGSRG
jgi:hypothetical protein